MQRVHIFVSFLFVVVLLFAVVVSGPLAALSAGENRLYLPLIIGGGDPPPGGDGETGVTAATYLGGAGEDSTSGVAVAPDGSVVLAGMMPGHNPGGATPVTLLDGGDGVVVRLDPDGQAVRSVTRIGDTVTDLEINDSGNIVVCGAFGVAVLNATASATVWDADPGTGKRCALGSDGTAAVLVGSTAYLYDSDGTPLENWNISGNGTNDIAVDGANNLVIATGYTQVSGNLQIAFIRAWDYSGSLDWKSYDFSSAPGLGADTRGERIAIGHDGQLYFAGSINGGTGASIFSRDPKDFDQNIDNDPRVVKTDDYTRATNIGSVKMTWFGRYEPTDGTLVTGQSLLTRRTSNNKGNSIGVNAITADATGRVYLAGSTSCCIKERDSQQIAGITVGGYEGSESYFMALSADFKERLVWTPFAGPDASAGGSPATGVGVRDGVVAVSVSLNPKTDGTRSLITYEALQAAPATLPEGYLAIWSFK